MQFMFGYPELRGTEASRLDPGPVSDLAAAAEAAGFGGFAVTEHPAPSAKWLASGGHATLDPFVALGNAAAVTTRLRLLTYLTVLPYRNPMLVAKAAATVDIVSGGRFILGVGTGYLKGEFRALGVDFDERNDLFDEALDVLPMHWSGEPFSYQGRHFEARDVVARPAPPRASIPIWIGGNSALSRRRVAERGHGWMPMIGPAELFATTRTPSVAGGAELAPMIHELRASAAGHGVEIDVAVAYAELGAAGPAVDAERHREAFAALAEAGVTWIVIPGTTTSRAASLDFLAGFGTTYLGS